MGLLMQACYVASYLGWRGASHLLLCDAAGCCKGLCKTGVVIRHLVRHAVQVGHRQCQILRHGALHGSHSCNDPIHVMQCIMTSAASDVKGTPACSPERHMHLCIKRCLANAGYHLAAGGVSAQTPMVCICPCCEGAADPMKS